MMKIRRISFSLIFFAIFLLISFIGGDIGYSGTLSVSISDVEIYVDEGWFVYSLDLVLKESISTQIREIKRETPFWKKLLPSISIDFRKRGVETAFGKIAKEVLGRAFDNPRFRNSLSYLTKKVITEIIYKEGSIKPHQKRELIEKISSIVYEDIVLDNRNWQEFVIYNVAERVVELRNKDLIRWIRILTRIMLPLDIKMELLMDAARLLQRPEILELTADEIKKSIAPIILDDIRNGL